MSLSSLNQAVNNLQKDFDIASYNFFLFTESNKICIASKRGVTYCNLIIPFTYKTYTIILV